MTDDKIRKFIELLQAARVDIEVRTCDCCMGAIVCEPDDYGGYVSWTAVEMAMQELGLREAMQ